ncbi:hypothetical protein ACQEVZ_60675 [Dactylosporangium sp. CA-152071]|uniref:hypothetical protein n=1 Tax=Dactylosporangium sp. CA-152071 TaxID=3239933 RepID=UPI003D8F4BB0
MLQIRVEGDPAESQVLLDVLRAAGVEVQAGTVKRRAEGVSHTYAVAHLGGHLGGPRPAGDTAPRPAERADAAAAGPVRVPSTTGRALPAAAAAGRRPARTRHAR